MLLLRLVFVLLLYLFLFRLATALRRDLRLSAEAASRSGRSAPATEGRLIVLSGGPGDLRSGQSFALKAETVIGRAPDCDVHLDDSLVSGRHACLRRRDGRWFIEDLDSTNGTLLNQQPLEGVQPIEYGDLIAIADVRLKLSK